MGSLRLLLDEHYPASVTVRLTQRGVDAQGVIERADLRGRDDRRVLDVATAEGRVVVTEDVTTFLATMAKTPSFRGVIFCEAKRFPRRVSAFPRLEDALVNLVDHPPAIAEFPRFVWWL